MAKEFTLSFTLDNDAFQYPTRNDEVARIILDIHNRILFDNREDGVIYDLNGNKIGQWSMDEAEDNDEN